MSSLPSSPTSQPARVIVVDDEFGARHQVELALAGSSTARLVAQATNGMRGAELVELEQPDIVVLDLDMPVMSGYEALPLMRLVSPHSRIIVRTNVCATEAEERVLRLGAERLIRKFMAPDELRAVIEQAARDASAAADATSAG